MKLIIRLLKYAKPWSKYLIWATVTLFAVSVINLVTPYVARSILAIMEEGNLESSLNLIILLAMVQLGFFALRGVLQFITSYFSHLASWRLVSEMRCRLYDHFQTLSMSYYHDKQTGQLMSRVISDTATFENLISHALPDLATNILTLFGVLGILLFINPTLTLLVCIPIPFIALLSRVLRKVRRFFRQGQVNVADLNAALQDNFSGMKEIQVFNKQVHESRRVAEKSHKHATALINAMRQSSILNPTVTFISSLGSIIVLIGGPVLAIKTGLSIADVVAFLLYLNLFYTPISTLTRVAEDLQQGLAGVERVFEVLDTRPEVTEREAAVHPGRLSGQISFEHVSFAYKDEIPVLQDVSFDIAPGQMIALVGPTGVGKTTVASLITRFYDVQDGRVTMDGHDIRDLTLAGLRDQLSIVLQDVFLFNGTISENIAYGRAGASLEEIRHACRIACIDSFIESLPDGYDTLVGERGVRLSGGQKQRISIARSILRDSPVLILDEATSSVDTETEQYIQRSIDQIAGTRTLIVIAHRLSTVRRADRIIVLDQGRIAEQGTHEELMAANGIYTNLCNIQSLL